MTNLLYSPESLRKASLSNLHTHEATGSSPVVSTKNHRNRLIPVIFFRDPQLFMALNFWRFFKTHTLTHTGKGAESTGQGQTGIFLSGPVFSAHLLADDPTDGVCSVLFHLGRGMGVGVQGEPSRVVAQRAGERFHVYPAFQRQRCEGVPLRYNYDKPEKPRISRVFGYLARFFILFQTEKSSREVVIS